MTVVLDTNVLSELMRTEPFETVAAWMSERAPGSVVLTAITVAEVRVGVARLPRGRRRDTLSRLADAAFAALPGDVLPFDGAAAEHYADLVAERAGAGRPIDGFDAQIAAICRAHGAALATRNVRHFAGTGIDLVDPWTA